MIRQAGRDDIRGLAELWARAFPGERTVEDRIAHLETGGIYGGLEYIWLAERAQRLVGAYRAYALTQHMHGTGYRMMGLAAVAVDETTRRAGLGRELCAHAARMALERGDVLSMLYPFRPSFYHALGWGLVGELHAFRFRPESLLHVGDGAVRRATDDDTSAVAACYGRVAGETNGLITRTTRVWRQHLHGYGNFTYMTGDDRVRGYLIARHGRAQSPDDRPLYIRELVAEDSTAYDALLGWIHAQRDSWRLIQYEATPDEHFAHRLSDPRPPGYHLARNLWAPVARVIRGPMLRLLDVPAALQQRVRWGPARAQQFTLELRDELIPENAGVFTLDYNGDNVAVRRGGHGNGPALRTEVAVFAQIFAGELAIKDAVRLGAAEAAGDISGVDLMFRTDRCFRLLDEF